ncbi:MAG: hypothetical protein WCK33_06670 [Phycisphaerae bacterium]|jgi:hypothetical protein
MRLKHMALIGTHVAVAGTAAMAWLISDPCADQAVAQLISSGAEGATMGRCDADGQFAVAVAVLGGDSRQAFEQAKMAAQRAIAEQFGVNISGESISTDSSKTAGNLTEFSSFFSSTTSTSVRDTLRGIAARGVVDSGTKRLAIFVLTQRSIERQGDLRRAVNNRNDEPAAVVATGVAMVRDSRADTAARVALDSAKRQAVEMVMGAMMIGQSNASVSSTDQTERFGSYVFSNSAGFIDSYRVLEERQDSDVYVVRIEATIVPKKLFDSYREHLQSVGDPVFGIDANGDPRLLDSLTEYFIGKGLKIKEGVDGADFLINAKMKYTAVKDPADPERTGIRGELAWSIVNATTRQSMSQMQTDGRSTSFLGSDDNRQKDLVLEQIMKKKGPEIHGKLQEFVAKLVAGRSLRADLVACPDLENADVREKFLALLRLHPQVEDLKPSWKTPDLTLELTVVGRTDTLGSEIARMVSEAGGTTQVAVKSDSAARIELGVR